MTHTLRRTLATFLLMLLLGAPALHGQSPRGPVPVRVGLTAANGELRTASGAMVEWRRQVAVESTGETEWLKGGVIGALLLGVPSALLWGELARYSDNGSELGGYLAGFVIGGGVGFFIGALIGGQFEK